MISRAILEDASQLTKLSHGWVDPTSPNLAKTEGDHRGIAFLFQNSDILLHFQTQAAQS